MIEFQQISKNSGYNIYIENISTGVKVTFPGFVTSISDSYTLGWKLENVYGRMDPIATYARTSRACSINFDILSPNHDYAKENAQDLKTFIRMLYPKVSMLKEGTTTSRVLSAPPLLRIRFANLFQSSVNGDGLLAIVKGFNYKPANEPGWVLPAKGIMFAKEYNVSLSFDVLHEHELGWNQENKWLGGENFPHALEQTNSQQFLTTSTAASEQTATAQSRINEVTGGS